MAKKRMKSVVIGFRTKPGNKKALQLKAKENDQNLSQYLSQRVDELLTKLEKNL